VVVNCRDCAKLIFTDCSVTCESNQSCEFATFQSTGQSTKVGNLEIKCEDNFACRFGKFYGINGVGFNNDGDYADRVMI